MLMSDVLPIKQETEATMRPSTLAEYKHMLKNFNWTDGRNDGMTDGQADGPNFPRPFSLKRRGQITSE